jgi:hypothetical protein
MISRFKIVKIHLAVDYLLISSLGMASVACGPDHTVRPLIGRPPCDEGKHDD